jgi:hypothetical protein
MVGMSPHARAVEMSLRLHAAVADRLLADPTLVDRARARVAAWIEDGTVARPYALAWQALLEAPLPSLVGSLREPSERMHDLRQVSPFAGVLDARERWRLRRAGAA